MGFRGSRVRISPSRPALSRLLLGAKSIVEDDESAGVVVLEREGEEILLQDILEHQIRKFPETARIVRFTVLDVPA